MLVEFVIPLPFTLEEYNRGQLHMTAQMSENSTSATDGGVEIVVNEPFDNTDGHWGVSPITGIAVPRTRGQYTLKRYHIKSKFPSIVVAMLPENAMFLIEESWNAYPHIRTVLVNAYFSVEKFRIDIESMHIPDDVGGLDNPLGFTAAELASRKREVIDIAVAGQQRDDKEFKGLYRPEDDPTVTKSAKSGRGPFAPGWFKEYTGPRLCVYKVARITFAYFPAQGTVESMVASSQLRLFGRSLSAVVGRTDQWWDLSLADVREYEAAIALRCKGLIDAYLAKTATPPSIPGAGYAREREAAAAAAAGGASPSAGATPRPAGGAAASGVPGAAAGDRSEAVVGAVPA